MATELPLTTRSDLDDCCPGASGALLDDESARAYAATFKALADPTRVRLLRYLADSADGTACACHLPDALGISQPTLSFHLHRLYDAGLVERSKRGRWVHWTVQSAALEGIRTFLALPSATCGRA